MRGRGSVHLREFEPTAVAFEQAAFEGVFEPLDLLADGALREVQRVGGHRHAGVFRHGNEGAHEGDVEVLGHRCILEANAWAQKPHRC